LREEKSVSKNVTVVILAGGQGTRFWPMSRVKKPKQFLSMLDTGHTLIQETVKRLKPLVSEENCVIVSSAEHYSLVKEQLPKVQIISEPRGRNTAPCIGLAALYLLRNNPESVMIALPADHVIKDEEKLVQAFRQGIEAASSRDVLVTLGVPPTHAHTGYGYIKKGEGTAGGLYRVASFHEKPTLENASKYIESGDFYWNSGMFIWRAEVILDAIEQHIPALHASLMRINEAIGSGSEQAVVKEEFEKITPVSIDFGVLEHADNCEVIPAEPFGWSDIGSWDAWAEYFVEKKANFIKGQALLIDSEGCIIHSEHRMTAVLGLNDLVVIDSGDATLVCKRERVQEVKKIVDELRRQEKENLL